MKSYEYLKTKIIYIFDINIQSKLDLLIQVLITRSANIFALRVIWTCKNSPHIHDMSKEINKTKFWKIRIWVIEFRTIEFLLYLHQFSEKWWRFILPSQWEASMSTHKNVNFKSLRGQCVKAEAMSRRKGILLTFDI